MISQTVEYALRAMSYLASLPDQGDAAASSEAISQATQVPQGYLSKVMRSLVCADLVRSYRGPKGGFVLARAPDRISVLHIVDAVDPIKRIERCPLDNPLHTSLCPLHRCLDDAFAHIERVFDSTSLASVLQSACEGGQCQRLLAQQMGVPRRLQS